MKRRKLGGLEVAAIGLGCMSMTPIYGEPSEPEAIATVHRAAELGVDLVDTSDAYNNGRNEELVGRAIKGVRDRIVLATKFGQIRRPDGGGDVCGRPDYVKSACEASLKRLAVDCIDLYYIPRIDPTVPPISSSCASFPARTTINPRSSWFTAARATNPKAASARNSAPRIGAPTWMQMRKTPPTMGTSALVSAAMFRPPPGGAFTKEKDRTRRRMWCPSVRTKRTRARAA